MAITSHVPVVTAIPPRFAFTGYLVPFGRILFVLLFLMAAPSHFTQGDVNYATQNGVPAAGVLVPLAGVLALLGGLSVALGFYTRAGALLLAIFLLPVTFMMHDFWSINDPMQRQLQQIMFMKNISMLGATFLLMYFGPGPFSLDTRRQRVL